MRLSRILIREGADPKVSGHFFQGGEPGGVVVWGGDEGTDPQDGAGPEYFSTQGRVTAHQEASEETEGWELVIPLIGGVNVGSRLWGDWYICYKEVEYGRTVYCDATDSGPL